MSSTKEKLLAAAISIRKLVNQINILENDTTMSIHIKDRQIKEIRAAIKKLSAEVDILKKEIMLGCRYSVN